ncbi:hypothetical protein EMPG_10042 [Blastomyces silverae]|uniref:Uncharacterized protein n=1 Tax=Blastomyces silverae TaxID=2060906 RepID=A0A0H1B597_9EURO|nr:hypothetical protein EMPG_10042 [Blastomyces silverae]
MTSTRTTKSLKQRKDSSAIGKNNGQNLRKPPLNRPKKRNIVRWNNILYNRLLLCIQSACSANGIKLPWEAVAELMGGSISDGAITQQLTKLRAKLVEEGEPVPPPLKRGGRTSAGGGAKVPDRPKRSTVANKNVKVEISSDDDDDDDDSDDWDDSNGDSMAVASCLRNNLEKNENADINADIDKDNRSESSTEYVAVGASFLQFPNDPSPPLPPAYRHDHNYNAQFQPKGNAKRKIKGKDSAQSNAKASLSSGSSPQQKLVKLRIGTRGRANCDGNRAVGDNGIGANGNGNGNDNVNALRRRLSSGNMGSISSHTVHSSPESTSTVEMDVGGNTGGMIHGTGTIGQLHQQHYHHGPSPYGWPRSNGGSPHMPPAEMLRQLGHHVEYPNHSHNSHNSHNNHMARAGFQQGGSSFGVNPNGVGRLHGAASPYQDNTHMFPYGGMPPPHSLPPNNPAIPIPIPVQGGYSAEGMWPNIRNNNSYANIPHEYRTNITGDQRPHRTTHNHNHNYNRDSRTPTITPPDLPYHHSTNTEARAVGRNEIENPPAPAAPTTLIEHAQIADHQKEQQPDEQGHMLEAVALEDQAAIMDELNDLPRLTNFNAEFVHLDGGHVEDLFDAYGYGIEGVF